MVNYFILADLLKNTVLLWVQLYFSRFSQNDQLLVSDLRKAISILAEDLTYLLSNLAFYLEKYSGHQNWQ